jgi:zinc/manganese transport system substrate-binding protein/manganese/iron transport system substrate-binding protein
MKTGTACWVLLLAIVTLPAGSANAADKPPADRLKVATSVAPITDIVRQVGGDAIEVTGVIPEGRDSHTYEPAPSDARILSSADVIIMNGLHLETPIQKLALKVKKTKAPIFELGEAAITRDDWQFDFSFPKEKGNPNPHLWVDIAFAGRYAEITRDRLSRVDPAHARIYAANTTAYLAKLSRLDNAAFACVASIPAANRKLVTYHDSFAYFAPRYGMQVIAAVQPADFAEPAPKDVAAIIDQLRLEKVPAIFGSEVFPSPVLEQIAREAGAKYVTDLRDDELPGEPNTPGHTYVAMMVNNLTEIVGGLGGDPRCASNVGS